MLHELTFSRTAKSYAVRSSAISFRSISTAPNIYKTINIKTKDQMLSMFLYDSIVNVNAARAHELEISFLFLEANNLLQDIAYSHIGMLATDKPRIVFGNKHLYDPYQIGNDGKNNIERMLKCKSPLDTDNITPHCIHHFDQRHHGAWVVMPTKFHTKFYTLLHSKQKLIDGVNRVKFAKERAEYWRMAGQESIISEFEEKNIRRMSVKP